MGRLTFASFFEKLILIAFISATGQIDAFFVKLANFTDSLLRAVGQPTIFGTPLVVRQRIKFSLSTALSFGQNLNLMCVLNDESNSQTSLPRAIGIPLESRTVLIRAVG